VRDGARGECVIADYSIADTNYVGSGGPAGFVLPGAAAQPVIKKRFTRVEPGEISCEGESFSGGPILAPRLISPRAGPKALLSGEACAAWDCLSAVYRECA
jgi:hypothetical protein